MAEIQNNYALNPKYEKLMAEQMPPQQGQYPSYGITAPQITLRDEFVTEHKKNGLVGRLYNIIKNATGIGIGSKKAEAAVTKAENGEITEDEARETIKSYRNSQGTISQITGDALSIGGAIGGFIGGVAYLKEESPKAFLRKVHGLLKKKDKKSAIDAFKIDWNKLRFSESELIDYFKNSKGATIKLALMATIGAGVAKWLFGIIDRIGSSEFVVDKKDFNNVKTPYDKTAYQTAKKYEAHEKFKANIRNFFSGAINAITLPITGLLGGIAGVPLYFGINSLNRYFIGNHTDEDKSFSGYLKDLKNDSITHTALALGIGIPVFLKTHDMHLTEKASRAAVEDLRKIKLQKKTPLNIAESNYDKVSKILLESPEIKAIFEEESWINGDAELQELANKLIKQNFFAAKFKQISNDGSKLARILKEDLLPTRKTAKDAQAFIDGIFGKGKYEIVSDHYCLGVGTVAETYFAKDLATGQEVCIKTLKDGITKEKILADKENYIKLIKELTTKPGTDVPITEAERTSLLKNVEDLAEGVLKEIDFQNEFNAAQKLAESTQFAHVVKGLAVKDGAYVMERANGISLESLMNLNEAHAVRDALVKKVNGGIFGGIDGAYGELLMDLKRKDGSPLKVIMDDWKLNDKEKIAKIDEYIAKIEAKTPSHGEIKLEPEDLKNLITEYQQVLVEQFNKIPEGAKAIHGDIHPGNIFVDIDALKSIQKPSQTEEMWSKITGRVNRKNHKIFTLIDTGNIIELNKDQSLSLLNLSSYIEHGNYSKIAEYVMQGVEGEALGGKTKEEATKLVADELKKYFIDPNYPLDVMTNDNLIRLTSNIMEKNGIVPNNTQLNLNKAMQSANNSYDALVDGLLNGRLGDAKMFKELFGMGDGAKDSEFLKKIKKSMEKAQEKENLRHMSASQRKAQKRMEGNLNPHQKEYHIYKLKQALYESLEATEEALSGNKNKNPFD